MIEPCTFANGHCWHPDFRYRDPGPTPRPEAGFIYQPNTAERCCLCDAQHVTTIGPIWRGPWKVAT